MNDIENRIVKYIAENGPSSPYEFHIEPKRMEYGNISAFKSLHSAGVIFPIGEKSEHGGQKFDFTALGSLYALHRGNFDLQKAKSYWGRTTKDEYMAAGTELLDRFENELGTEESNIKEEMIRMLLYDHARGATHHQIFTQLARVYQNHPALDMLKDNPIVQNAVQRLRPSFIKSDLSTLDQMQRARAMQRIADTKKRGNSNPHSNLGP